MSLTGEAARSLRGDDAADDRLCGEVPDAGGVGMRAPPSALALSSSCCSSGLPRVGRVGELLLT